MSESWPDMGLKWAPIKLRALVFSFTDASIEAISHLMEIPPRYM